MKSGLALNALTISVTLIGSGAALAQQYKTHLRCLASTDQRVGCVHFAPFHMRWHSGVFRQSSVCEENVIVR